MFIELCSTNLFSPARSHTRFWGCVKFLQKLLILHCSAKSRNQRYECYIAFPGYECHLDIPQISRRKHLPEIVIAANKCYLSNAIYCSSLIRVFREIREIRDSEAKTVKSKKSVILCAKTLHTLFWRWFGHVLIVVILSGFVSLPDLRKNVIKINKIDINTSAGVKSFCHSFCLNHVWFTLITKLLDIYWKSQ